MLKIIPLGGLGEIGLNMMLFEYGDSMFLIDAGLMFPEDYMYGVDIVIPDIRYIKNHKSRLAGIVLTHAHEDHIGALPFFLKEVHAPVFGTSFTLGVVRNKLEEHGLISSVVMHEINTDEVLRIGAFDLEFIAVNHSVVGGVGVAINTPVGLIIHTGDFKISSSSLPGMMTDISKFARFGKKGVLALLSDSTNVERQGHTKTSEEVAKALSEIISDREGRVIIALFASNIGRIQSIVNIARAKERKVVFNGRSIETNIRIARDLGYIHVPEGLEIKLEQMEDYPDRNILMIMTGSQGEPMSALARMSSGSHARAKIKSGDTVILSSKFIPGNEKAITKIINDLYRLGADVIYEKISFIHISGHAFQEELKMMINIVKPKYFIPIHGEYRHLILHGRLAKATGIPEENVFLIENGQILELDEKGCRINGRVPSGRILVDGKGVGDIGKSVLQERRILSRHGIVAVTIAFDEDTGYIVYGPEFTSRGFVFELQTGHLLRDAECVVLEVIEEVDFGTSDRVSKIRSKIVKALKKYFYFAIRRRPQILTFIIEV
ncbi:MAG TPA: ribonuclease J [Desulfobacteraceae bacterium]|nr:ribonuclease J [Desulfobacteraceae bacterium]